MPPDKLKRVDRIAQATQRSRAWVINEAVDRFLDYEEWFAQAVQVGIEDADRDKFASDDAVHKRFKKWGVTVAD